MHACARSALSATGRPRAANTLRMTASEADAALPQRTAATVRDLLGHVTAGNNVPAQMLVCIHDAEAGRSRNGQHKGPTAIRLVDHKAGKALPGFRQATTMEPEDYLRLAGCDVDL